MESREHQIRVSRTARYFTLGHQHPAVAQVWFVCHGYGELAEEFLRYFEPLDDGTRLVVAPEALARFYRDEAHSEVGASWMTKEDRLTEIDDYVAYLETLYTQIFQHVKRDAVEVFVLGFSQGVATAARWIAHGAVHAEHLVLWSGLIPPEFRSREGFRRLRAIDLTLVSGTKDRWVTDTHVAEQRERLTAHGIQARELTFEGGHRLDEDTLFAIARSSG